MIKCGNITVMVSDIDAAVKFYTQTLGLKLKNRYGNEWAEVEADTLTIGLHPSKKKSKSAGNTMIGFSVDDLDSEVKKLEKNGLKFKVFDDGPVTIAQFTDPDGTPLYLAQEKKNIEWR